MTACKTHELQRRQASVEARKLLKASLHCERIALRWEYTALVTAVGSAFLPLMHRDLDALKVALQFGAVALIAWFKRRSSARKKDATALQNEFEYFVFHLFKPYEMALKTSAVDRFSRAYDKKPTNKDVSKWFAGRCDLESDETPSFAEQVRSAQRESMRFGSHTRRIWGSVVTAICVGIIISYALLSDSKLPASSTQVLSSIAAITVILQIAAIARTNFKYSAYRTDLSNDIEGARIPQGADYLAVAPVFQERINGLRKDRPLVPKWVYAIRSSRDKPCACTVADNKQRGADIG